ncbi:MAG: flavodoxin family protein [Candidatus Thorarchaeota archaeon]
MKYLVVYYSRSGNNKTLANAIAKSLSADLDEIVDKKKRSGKLGWLRAGRDAQAENLTDISIEKNPQDYDIIIIGSPIWASKLTPAVRTYLAQQDLKNKQVAFFICSGGDGYAQVFPLLKQLTPDSVHLSTLGINEKQFKEGSYEPELNAFIESLK